MGPKAEAGASFTLATGNPASFCSIAGIEACVEGDAGTVIVRD